VLRGVQDDYYRSRWWHEDADWDPTDEHRFDLPLGENGPRVVWTQVDPEYRVVKIDGSPVAIPAPRMRVSGTIVGEKSLDCLIAEAKVG
jgi:hypothetical protein